MGLRPDLIIALIIAFSISLVTVTLSYQVLSSQNQETNAALLPPIASNTDDSRHIIITLSQNGSKPDSGFNVTQGTSTQINVILSSISDTNEFIIPLYLSVGSFENQQLAKIITSPPAPYPTLPWSSHNDMAELAKPFEAIFSINPLTLKPEESKTVILTITALENTRPGKYTMLLELGNWEQTGLSAVTFQMDVLV